MGNHFVSYLSQSDLRAHFGLGSTTRIDTVEVSWPSGAKQAFRNLAADRFYFVEEAKDPLPVERMHPSAPPASLKNER